MRVRTALILAALAAAPLRPAAALDMQSCKNNANAVRVTWEAERGARRASDGATAFSYTAVLRNFGLTRGAWVTFTYPGAENAAYRVPVQLPGVNSADARVRLGTVWGRQLDQAALDRATEVLCEGQ